MKLDKRDLHLESSQNEVKHDYNMSLRLAEIYHVLNAILLGYISSGSVCFNYD